MRTAQAMAAWKHTALNYVVLDEVLSKIGEFGGLEVSSEAPQRNRAYYGEGYESDRNFHLEDLKAVVSTVRSSGPWRMD